MVKMGLKELDSGEKRWSHPPKKKWIYNYLADGKERQCDTLLLWRYFTVCVCVFVCLFVCTCVPRPRLCLCVLLSLCL